MPVVTGLAGDPQTQPGTGQETLGATDIRGQLEAVLLVVDEPVTVAVLAAAVQSPEPRVARELDALRDEYAAERRGFDLREVGGGWRLYTRGDFAAVVERFMVEGQHARLTQAALETLAVVAYRQPVSRSRVSAVRGVNVDGVMRTLTSRGLVEEAGTDEATGAVLYRTTSYFLERLGLRELAQLPKLADFLPESTSIEELEEQVSSGGRDE
jgi:segregation and condensation protein B